MGTSSYGALYEWGDGLITINSAFDEMGDALALTAVMQVALPEDPAAGVQIGTTFQLPFDGAWMVIWGGESEFQNYHAPTPPQRYAHDIVIWRDGATYTGDGMRNEDYHCYGQPQYAPASGTVVVAIDGYADDTPGSTPTADPTMHPAGNHVVIEVAEGEYVLMAHLRPGTLAVSEGQAVQAGDLIGLTGNSGNSSEPHVHIHMQTGPDMFDPATVGLPMTFVHLLVNGEPVEATTIEQGQIVEHE
jgi:murein DD-endopeptidase MepM/ murein hydrolase activator NlpD